MEHTQIVTANELESFSDTRDSEAVIPELVWMLVNEVPDLTACRIPYGDAVNQPGWDGLVETDNGFKQFVPRKQSFWEIGTNAKPQRKATKDFTVRTRGMSQEERQEASYVFVTPRGSGSGGWNEPAQSRWITRRKRFGWKNVKIIDGVQLADWLREFPAIGKWLLKKTGLVKTSTGFTTPREHWDNLQQLSRSGDPPLPPKLFLVGRDQARTELERLFGGQIRQAVLAIENELDAEDFVAAFLASLEPEARRAFSNKCLFVKEADAWNSLINLKTAHVLVAHPNLDLESSGEQLHLGATSRGHAIVIPVSGAWVGGGSNLIPLRSPSASLLEATLTEASYKPERAKELAEAGALSLASLKRHLRGIGELPPYATWPSARFLAQAGLIGRWLGENASDKAALETVVGKSYGEWIELVRQETLRSDTPLTQRNESWKVISRGEAWTVLGPQLTNDDLERFKNAALIVLGERDPRFELPPDDRFAASMQGKVLQHSSALRKGMAETLALLGSRPTALTSCTQQKSELVALLVVRSLLKDADWVTWASLDSHLPMLAEAAPDEFLDAVEAALLDASKSAFSDLFAQERPGITGWNHMSGLLWALETLAWHSDHLVRVSMLLAELAEIDPGGNWSNRPINSLKDIFLPWHPQTCADIPKRKAAVDALLREHPAIGWELLMALLPTMHGVTSGSRKPAWRPYIPADWSEGGTNRDYWQQVSGYAELAVKEAAIDLKKLAELIDRLPDLPKPAHTLVLEHLESSDVAGLPEGERQPMWEALVDLVAKHRKFSDAQWALPADAVDRIDEVGRKLAPRSLTFLHRRLFSGRDFDLYEEKGDYEEQRRRLDERRKAAVEAIFQAEGLSSVLDFARQVSSSNLVGIALGWLDHEDADSALLPERLNAEEKAVGEFIRGFVWGRFWAKSWVWVDAMSMVSWTASQQASFFALLPFMHDTWRRAEQMLGDQAGLYWSQAPVNPWGPQEHLVEATEKLLQYGRPSAALECLNRLVQESEDFPPDLAVRCLLACLQDQQRLDQHNALEVIAWLQKNPAADPNALFRVEWSYLALLDHEFGGTPRTLERRIADDPKFFCEVLGLVFRSDKEERREAKPGEAEAAIATNAFRLFRAWKTVPGSNPEGGFNSAAFASWLSEVKTRTQESGHHRIAMSQIGEVLPYAPADPDGLWIHEAVAEALNAKDAGEMRSGFTCELFNMRGTHGYTAGKEEREIAAGYYTRAEALDQKGYHRFATAIRELVKSYERDAEREASRSPFED